MKKLWFVICAALLAVFAGCTALPGDPSKMTPEQLKANAKDKNASVACTNGKTAAGNVTMVYVNTDQAVKLASQVVVETDCKTTITTTSEPTPRPVAAGAGAPSQ